jgi:hypothetical protein
MKKKLVAVRKDATGLEAEVPALSSRSVVLMGSYDDAFSRSRRREPVACRWERFAKYANTHIRIHAHRHTQMYTCA